MKSGIAIQERMASVSDNISIARQRIEIWPIERLREYPRNPRKNDGAMDRMSGVKRATRMLSQRARHEGELL
jgi:hypothetical protein